MYIKHTKLTCLLQRFCANECDHICVPRAWINLCTLRSVRRVNVSLHMLQLYGLSPVWISLSCKCTGISECFATYITAVWFTAGVNVFMSLEMTILAKRFITLVKCVLFFCICVAEDCRADWTLYNICHICTEPRQCGCVCEWLDGKANWAFCCISHTHSCEFVCLLWWHQFLYQSRNEVHCFR